MDSYVPARVLLSTGGVELLAEAVEVMREKLGLNKPIMQRNGTYSLRLGQRDVEKSFFTDDAPVAASIISSLRRKLELFIGSTILSMLISPPFGVVSATRRGSLASRMLALYSGIALSALAFVTETLTILNLCKTCAWCHRVASFHLPRTLSTLCCC